MAKKPTKQPERIRCADCVHGKPHKGLAVWCEILNTGRVRTPSGIVTIINDNLYENYQS